MADGAWLHAQPIQGSLARLIENRHKMNKRHGNHAPEATVLLTAVVHMLHQISFGSAYNTTNSAPTTMDAKATFKDIQDREWHRLTLQQRVHLQDKKGCLQLSLLPEPKDYSNLTSSTGSASCIVCRYSRRTSPYNISSNSRASLGGRGYLERWCTTTMLRARAGGTD